MIGKTLSHYEIVDIVGAGGMGEVYLARDPRLGRQVAIKVLPVAMSQDADRLARFEREARAVAALNHPNILSVFDVGNENGVPFLVTEYLEGETLRRRIESGGLPQRKTLEYAAKIADGLAAAHARSIIHRDLKPDNIFITRDGQLKILDFGLAKLTEPVRGGDAIGEEPTEQLTAPHLVVGTHGYMSPEQLLGDQVDSRTDIFAFGVILYEMISGRKPFSGSSGATISASIMRDDPPPLLDEKHPVPPTLDRMVRMCLEKDREDRFESAHDLAQMLRAVSDSHEVSAVRRPEAVGRSWRRSAIVAVMIVSACLIGWGTWRQLTGPVIPEPKHIAVLLFGASGDDPDGESLAAGLSVSVADGIALIERETRGAVWALPPTLGATFADAHKEHNATIAIRGDLQAHDGRVRLEVDMVEAATGKLLTRRTLDEDARNLTSLQKAPVLLVWEMLGFEAPTHALEDLDNDSTNTMIACRAFVAGRGRLLIADGRQDLLGAVASLEEAVRADPSHVPSRIALAQADTRLFEETGEEHWMERALEQAERAANLDEGAAAPFLEMGMAYLVAGRTEESLEAYRQAAARADTAGPHIQLGSAAIDTGEFDIAERAFQTAINLRPDFAESHLDLGYVYFTTGRLDAAANQFRQASRAAPRNRSAHINLGAVLALQKRTDEAIRAFEDALALEPDFRAYSNLGTLYFEDGRFGDAAEMFQNAIELAGEELPPEQYYLLGNLASSLHWSGQADAAKPAFADAVELAERQRLADASDPAVVVDLAGYYGMIGRNDRGIELLEALTEFEILDPFLMGTISESYEDLGERDRAIQWIATALANELPVDWIESRPSFNSLREDQRYRELVEHRFNRG
jgi:serine/threonine-protein kinase